MKFLDSLRMKFSLLSEVWQRGYTWDYRWYRFKEFFGLDPDWTPEEEAIYNSFFNPTVTCRVCYKAITITGTYIDGKGPAHIECYHSYYKA